jgi:hypothetical protein
MDSSDARVLLGSDIPLGSDTPGVVLDAVAGAVPKVEPSRQTPSGWLVGAKLDLPASQLEAPPGAEACLIALWPTDELLRPAAVPALALARATRALSWLGIAWLPELPVCCARMPREHAIAIDKMKAARTSVVLFMMLFLSWARALPPQQQP